MGPITSRDLKCVFTGSENKNEEDSYFHNVYALDLEIGIVFFLSRMWLFLKHKMIFCKDYSTFLLHSPRCGLSSYEAL